MATHCKLHSVLPQGTGALGRDSRLDCRSRNTHTALAPTSTMSTAIEQGANAASNAATGVLSARVTGIELAQLLARAALNRIDAADAAIVDSELVGSELPAGVITAQYCVAAFKMESQTAGTPVTHAFYTATLSGVDLKRLRAELDPRRWGIRVAVAVPEDAQTYTLALQERPALHPNMWLPAGITLTNVTFHAEVWEIFWGYAQIRSAAGLKVDTDTAAD